MIRRNANPSVLSLRHSIPEITSVVPNLVFSLVEVWRHFFGFQIGETVRMLSYEVEHVRFKNEQCCRNT